GRLGNDRVGLDLDEQVRIDEAADLHHRRRRSNVAEELRMGAAHGLPVIHVRKEDSGSHNIVEACAGLGQGGLDLSEDVDGLTICISRGDDKTLFIHCSRARNCDPWTYADSPRISDNRFPLRTRRKVPAFHAVPAPRGPSSVPRKTLGWSYRRSVVLRSFENSSDA